MNRQSLPPLAATLLASTVLLSGCSTLGDWFSGDKVDYKSGAASRPKPLEVPPDLSQLARDGRYAQAGGVVSAAAVAQGGTASPRLAPAGPAVAPLQVGSVRVEKQGAQRWLVVDAAPEVLWPQLRAFWLEKGFTLTTDNAAAGVLETDWLENRSKLPNDIIRRTLGRVIDRLYDTGERDRFRTRLERTGTATEVYVSHRGLEEVYVGDRNESTAWRARPADAQLEAEMLAGIMTRLGARDEAAKAGVSGAPEAPARARAMADGSSSLEVDDSFDRAWRRVGLALDRSGFTVEDRDRSAGLYFVRYVDPRSAGKEEPGFFARLFGASENKGPQRYRILIKGSGAKSAITVLAADGKADSSETARTIVSLLVKELR